MVEVVRWIKYVHNLSDLLFIFCILRQPYNYYSLTLLSLNALQLHCVVPVLHGVQAGVRPHAGQACWFLLTLKNQTWISLAS